MVIVLTMPCAAQATPYIVKLMQQGSNVVAIGSGAFDLTGLTERGLAESSGSSLVPNQAEVDLGPVTPEILFYTGFTGPTSFGSGSETDTPSGAGMPTAIVGSPSVLGAAGLFVPFGYVSGTFLSSSATWNNASFTSLGITPGRYTWTWGEGAEQTFTLDAFTSVPEPAVLGMFGFGLFLLGGCVVLRRRQAGSAC